MTTVIEIVRKHLTANGFDGLVQPDAQCGCLCGALAPCRGDISSCEPAYRGADENGEPGDWAMYRTKSRALESVQKVNARARGPTPEFSDPRRACSGRSGSRWDEVLGPTRQLESDDDRR